MNTICVGDWANAAELTCKCISEAHESATGDGKNCDGKMMCSVVSCDAGCKFDHVCVWFPLSLTVSYNHDNNIHDCGANNIDYHNYHNYHNYHYSHQYHNDSYYHHNHAHHDYHNYYNNNYFNNNYNYNYTVGVVSWLSQRILYCNLRGTPAV